MIKFESYEQIVIYLVKSKVLKDSYIYFNNNTEFMEFIYLRFNVNHHQVEIDGNNEIHLNDKLGERFATIGKIISK